MFSLTGCWKDDVSCSGCFTIQGNFYTEGGTLPVKDVNLTLYYKFVSKSGFISTSRTYGRTNTDENGFYHFSFIPSSTQGTFYVSYTTPTDSYIVVPNFSFYIHRIDTTVIRNYNLPKKGGKILMKIKNPEDIPDESYLVAYGQYMYDDPLNPRYHRTGSLTSNGKTTDTIYTAANQYTCINMVKFIGDQQIAKTDSIYVNSGKTEYYEVEWW